MWILGQTACILGPTIFKIPQPNWYYYTYNDLLELKINPFFYRLIPEGGLPSENPASVKKVIFCTGKVYYDLTKARAAGELESDIAISRVEQICPFPFDLGTYIKFL